MNKLRKIFSHLDALEQTNVKTVRLNKEDFTAVKQELERQNKLCIYLHEPKEFDTERLTYKSLAIICHDHA